MNEHETEPVRGLPELLPAGETILWQGAPRWGALARRVFHVRKIALYFAILLAWLVYADIEDGIAPWSIVQSSLWVIGGAAVVIAILSILAWLTARSAIFTITTRRVVMRFGVAFPVTFNLPFRRIRSAGLRRYGDGSGDIPLALFADDRIAYLVLWPYARPWRFSQAEPMLRGLARERKMEAIGPTTPFRLTGYADGRLTLEDPETGRRIDIEAFGHTNLEVFSRLLPLPRSTTP